MAHIKIEKKIILEIQGESFEISEEEARVLLSELKAELN